MKLKQPVKNLLDRVLHHRIGPICVPVLPKRGHSVKLSAAACSFKLLYS